MRPAITMTLKLSGNSMADIIHQASNRLGADLGTEIRVVLNQLHDETAELVAARQELAATSLELTKVKAQLKLAIENQIPKAGNNVICNALHRFDDPRVQFPDAATPIEWIKSLRDTYVGIGLKEAKDAFLNLPCNHPDVQRMKSTMPRTYGSSEYLNIALNNRPRDIDWS